MNRRDFLKNMIKVFWAFFVVILFSFVIIYIYPSKIRKKQLRYIYILDEDELPKRGVKRVQFNIELEGRTVSNRAFIVASEFGLIALSSFCTHLGCLVNWDSSRKEFLCPCHGGKFDIKGTVISGPPAKPLAKLPLEIKGGKVYIGVFV